MFHDSGATRAGLLVAITKTCPLFAFHTCPLSSHHRSRVVESLCAALNKTITSFPALSLKCASPLRNRDPEAKADTCPVHHVFGRKTNGDAQRRPAPFQTPFQTTVVYAAESIPLLLLTLSATTALLRCCFAD